MADWVNIVDSALDPDAPLTSELAFAWRDNPIAIAEGAAGAPRIATLALAGDHTVTRLSSGGTAAATGLDAISRISGHSRATRSSGTGSAAEIRLSANGGTTWTAWSSILSISTGGPDSEFGYFDVNLINGQWTAMGARAVDGGTFSGSNFNAIQVRTGSSGSAAWIDFWPVGGKP